jgi:hypothetical protein
VTKHDEKVLLSIDEFHMLVGVVPAINRYMKQLNIALPIVKDYLDDTIEQLAILDLQTGAINYFLFKPPFRLSVCILNQQELINSILYCIL